MKNDPEMEYFCAPETILVWFIEKLFSETQVEFQKYVVLAWNNSSLLEKFIKLNDPEFTEMVNFCAPETIHL